MNILTASEVRRHLLQDDITWFWMKSSPKSVWEIVEVLEMPDKRIM